MMRTRYLLALSLFVLCASAASARAATIHVPADYPTIQQAVDASADGDTIEIAPGTYVENLDLGQRGVTLVGTGGASVTKIKAATATSVIVTSNYSTSTTTTIRGLTVSGGRAPYGGGLLAFGNTPVVVTDCVFDDNQSQYGYFGAAIACWTPPMVTIERCLFTNNNQQNDPQFYAGVISAFGTPTIVVRNNVFWHNPTRAVNVFNAGEGTIVENNTMVGNDGGIYIYQGPNETIAMRNNVIVGNKYGIETFDQWSYTLSNFENNLVYGNTVDFYRADASPIGTAGNISVPPAFVNEGAGDFHLTADSPAIDAGTAVGAPVDDYDRHTRPIDGNGDGIAAFDIGAFEAPTGGQYDVIIQDDRTGDTLRFATGTGAWSFSHCGPSAFSFQGTGSVRATGCTIQLTARGATTISATYNACRHTGSATVRSTSPVYATRLNDSNTTNDTGSCR